MNTITIKEIFGNESVELPKEIDPEAKVSPILYDGDVKKDSLVFFTERIHGDNPPIKISFDSEPPYAAVVNKSQEIIESEVPLIKVKSVRRSLASAYSAENRIDYSRLKIIGITGTNGKTTTATIIYKVLRSIGYSVGFIGTGKILVNDNALSDEFYSMTTPDPSLLYSSLGIMQSEGCEYVVMEVSSHSLALGKVAPIKFKYAIFTNLSEEHSDFHPSLDEYYTTKLSLFKQAECGLFNVDDYYGRRAYNEVEIPKKSIGIIYEADATARDVITDFSVGSQFYYNAKNLSFKVKSALPGAFNIYNVMCALGCLTDIGIKPCIAKRAIEHIKGIDGRMEKYESDVTAVIDYAHTPDAFYNCLKTLKTSNNNRQNLIVVFGCGGDRDKKKRKEFGRLASQYAEKIILTEDNNRTETFADIIADIARGIDYKEYRVIRDRESAIRSAIYEARAGDTIAIIGKGHERYKIENGSSLPFDERAIIKDALIKRRQINASKP